MEKEELIAYKDPKSPISEIFRTLRTNLQFMTSNKGLKTLLVTSSVPGEGKSWVSANLVSAFAQEGKKVIIVDSDMRKGRMHSIFNVEKKPGLSNYLSGVIDVEDKDNILNYVKQTKVENLYVMPTGDVPPNPSELLVSERMTSLIDNLKNIFDIVIFDGTPSLIVTDALIIARQVDASLIVTAYKETKIGDVEKIKKAIENVGGKIAGIVINKIPMSAKKYEHSYYYGKKENKQEKKTKDNEINKDVGLDALKSAQKEETKQKKEIKKKETEKQETKKQETKKKEIKKQETKKKIEDNKINENIGADALKSAQINEAKPKKEKKKQKTIEQINEQIQQEIDQEMQKIKESTKENNEDKGE